MGLFVSGQSGNPSGRPKVDKTLQEAARKHAEKALAVIVKGLDSDDEKVALTAANSLLDRGYGKPAQAITGADGENELRVIVRHLFTPPNGGDP